MPYDKHSVSSYLSSLLLPLIPKKEKKTGLLWLCNIYWGLSWWPSSLLPGYLWLAMPATDWLRPPEDSKDALREKKTWHIGVLLPLLSTSKSLLLSSLFWFMYSLIYLCICRRERQLGEALGTACSTFPLKGWMQHQKKPLSFESQLKSMAANPCSEYTQKNVGPILLWIRVKWGFARCHGNREGKTCCLKDGTVAASLWL